VPSEARDGGGPHDGSHVAETGPGRQREPATPPSAVVAGVPPGLDRAILACLAVSPEQRPASAPVLARELAATLPTAATRPLPAPTATQATRVVTAVTRRLRPARPRR